MRPSRTRARRSRLLIALIAVLGVTATLALPQTAVAVPSTTLPLAASHAVATGATNGAVVDTAIVKAADLSKFNPGNIISDALFYDGRAMTSAEIQRFLDQKIGRCENGKCLNIQNVSISSRDRRVSQVTGQVVCEAIQGGTMRASELIYRVQVACGISAKVILATLQKEQTLVTSRAPSDWNVQQAMGQACPDTAPCDPRFSGLGPQIVGGVNQLKIYKAGRFAKQPGTHYIQYNPDVRCGGTNVNIVNYATAALYNYTPYQPNASSLRAGYGEGDTCGSYGNRNFFHFYSDWFGSTQVAGGSPFGSLDSWTPIAGGVTVRGWTIDPDIKSSVAIRAKVDGEQAARATANVSRPDVANVHPAYGDAHGFEMTVRAPRGPAEVCVVANNVGVGSNRTLGCAVIDVPGGDPFGAVQGWQPVDGGVRISGWAIDPDTSGPVSLRIKSDEALALRAVADLNSAAVSESLPAFGPGHGFDITVPLPPGRQSVCVTVNNTGAGVSRTLACRTVDPQGGTPWGALDSVVPTPGMVTVSGWALDPDAAGAVELRVKLDEKLATRVRATEARSDFESIYPMFGDTRGFSVALPVGYGRHTVCVVANNTGVGTNRTLGCAEVELPGGDPFGHVDAVTAVPGGVAIKGWAIDPDTAAAVPLRVKVNGTLVRRVTASATRNDLVARYPGYGAAHGFAETIPLPAGPQKVCIAMNNVGAGINRTLRCATVQVPSSDPFGYVNLLEPQPGGIAIKGWVIDPDTTASVSVRVKSNDTQVTRFTANAVRNDLVTRYPGFGAGHGFELSIGLRSGRQQVCLVANNVGPGSNAVLTCRTVVVP